MKTSCGIIPVYEGKFLVVKPGGPFFAKNSKCYGFPKGELEQGESLLECAKREFKEETGLDILTPNPRLLCIYKFGNKRYVFYIAEVKEFNGSITSNKVTIQFKGRTLTFPEVKDPKLLSISELKDYISANQIPAVEKLEEFLKFNSAKECLTY